MTIIDGRTITHGTELNTDICIIGAGAAGITIAREFIGTHQQVCLIESGGFTFDSATQSLYEMDNIGYPQFETKPARNRYFGGTTNSWTGRCVPLSSIDFERRDWVPESGWEIQEQDLVPYYEKAAPLFNLPRFDQVSPEVWHDRSAYRDEKLFFNDRTFTPVVSLRHQKPVNFGIEYFKSLKQASNIKIYYHTNVTEIEPTDNATKVTHIQLACLEGNKFSIQAKIFILACGGLENPRLLLLSKKQNEAGLGNTFDTVGRYYMDHPKVEQGMLIPDRADFNTPLFFGQRIRNGAAQFGLRLSDQIQKKEKLLNHYLLLQPQFSEYGNCEPQAMGVSQKLCYFYQKLTQSPLRFNHILVRNFLEQIPNRESRVTLSDRRDRLGLQKLQLDWKIASQEREHLHRFQQILSRHLIVNKIGTLEHLFPLEETEQRPLLDAFHPMGTTRMSSHPKTGVVNHNCKVHGIHNLFIAGSSVFPTGGHANPTLTIVALALRLADHIKEITS
jgi:choline dehydrogenase-like flavoprotein